MSRWWRWLRPVLGVAVLAVLGWRVGFDALRSAIWRVDATAVAAALGIGALSTLACAGRWCVVARRLGLPLGLGEAVADYYRAQFLNAVLPAGVLGEADRAVRHGRRAGDLGRGVRAVVLERAGGQLVLFAAAALAVAFAPSAVVSGAGGLAAGLVVAGAVLAGALVAAGLAARWWPRAGAALAATLTDLRRGLARQAWPAVGLLSAAALAGHLALFLVAARSAGATAPVADLLPLLVLALLGMGLPLNVAGFGPREAFATVAFGAAGLGAALGLTVAVTYGLLTLVASLPGAVLLVVAPLAGGRPDGRPGPAEADRRPGAGWSGRRSPVVA